MGNGQFTLVDGAFGYLLGVVGAAEKLMRESVVGLRGENLMETGRSFIDASLQKQGIGLRGVCQCVSGGEQQQQC